MASLTNVGSDSSSFNITEDNAGKILDTGDNFVTDYVIINKYYADLKTWMLGITLPNGFQGQSVAFVKLANQSIIWACDWTVRYEGGEPDIPDPFSTIDRGWVLLGAWFQARNLELMPDGVSAKYRISGTYLYGHSNPDESIIRNINYPRPVYLEDSFTRTISKQKLKKRLTDGGGTVSTGGRLEGFVTGGDSGGGNVGGLGPIIRIP